MGYCMELRGSNFFISAKNKEKALQAIKDLAKDVNSWVNTDEFVNAKTLEEAMQAWSWHVEENDKGDVFDIYFEGEKLGDDTILLEAIAPYVKKGSYIDMTGEDSSIWRWAFDGKTMREKAATVSFI